MIKESVILLAAWIIIIILLIIFVPKRKIRNALTIFFFKQLMTWVFGLSVVQMRWIEYPVRLFSYASRTSFTFEYFAYPALCILFNLHYPNQKTAIRQFLHYFYFCSGITIIEVIIEKNTQLINYIDWTWYWTWITLYITFYFSRRFYLWFFKINPQHTA